MSFYHFLTLGHFDPLDFLLSRELNLSQDISPEEVEAIKHQFALENHCPPMESYMRDGCLRFPSTGWDRLSKEAHNIGRWAWENFRLTGVDYGCLRLEHPAQKFFTLAFFSDEEGHEIDRPFSQELLRTICEDFGSTSGITLELDKYLYPSGALYLPAQCYGTPLREHFAFARLAVEKYQLAKRVGIRILEL